MHVQLAYVDTDETIGQDGFRIYCEDGIPILLELPEAQRPEVVIGGRIVLNGPAVARGWDQVKRWIIAGAVDVSRGGDDDLQAWAS
jgi:hypothetical protein